MNSNIKITGIADDITHQPSEAIPVMEAQNLISMSIPMIESGSVHEIINHNGTSEIAHQHHDGEEDGEEEFTNLTQVL